MDDSLCNTRKDWKLSFVILSARTSVLSLRGGDVKTIKSVVSPQIFIRKALSQKQKMGGGGGEVDIL